MLAFATLLLASCSGSSTGTAPERPNILFVIMDDVGIDQMPSFGYGGATPPNMPNIDAVAQAGLRFGNTWSMPECSPGRAAMFVGRYPLRTNIYQAIGENDLANSQLTPDDMTTPKLLRTAGYESGLFGKFHLAGRRTMPPATARPVCWDGTTSTAGSAACRHRSTPRPAASRRRAPTPAASFRRTVAAARTAGPAICPTRPVSPWSLRRPGRTPSASSA
ncbi:sulfatase [Candidatus Skiveiella danica]|uniref:sulfatase family protein n=1 Tax=Candidatus Skiveiella danica TaxID=3386177 RepID=UPI0039B896EF